MGTPVDLIGKTFSRLTVVSFAGVKNKVRTWHCFCTCGGKSVVDTASLRKGNTRSCGCLKKESDVAKRRNTTHGYSRTRIYNTWASMKQRCEDPGKTNYKWYGGRGIKVCDRWQSFSNFIMDMGERPDDQQIDRINPDGNYSPDNCRWVSSKENASNRRSTIIITVDGINRSLKQWCQEKSLNYHTAITRLNRDGWSIQEVINGRRS